MNIAVIQASTQINKNELIFDTVKKNASSSIVYNFGCNTEDKYSYSYIEISILIGLLIASKSIDFVVTGCSSGQGMMLACNNMPGILCGYVPTPKDAYLFAQINNGNVVSLPLGEEYTYGGEVNLKQTIAKLFIEPFGQGYPKEHSKRKIKDTKLLKSIRKKSQVDLIELLNELDDELINKIMTKKDVIDFILENGKDVDLEKWIKGRLNTKKNYGII